MYNTIKSNINRIFAAEQTPFGYFYPLPYKLRDPVYIGEFRLIIEIGDYIIIYLNI